MKFLAAFILIFYSITLMDLALIKLALEPLPAKPLTGPVLSTKIKKPIIKPFLAESTDKIDTAKFLKMFREQSPNDLIYCLRNSGIISPLDLSANLNRKGALSNTYRISSKGLFELPKCLSEFLEQMNFSSLTEHLKKGSIQIHWQVSY